MRFVLLLLFAGLAHAEMALNPDVTQDNLAQTVCVPGYTKTVRPPVSFTNAIKYKLMQEAGLALEDAPLYELDHIIPLAVGGAPRSLDNLQLQPWAGPAGARVKDHLERRLQLAVCAGEVPLAEAQKCIYDDWQACAKQHPPKGPQ